MSQRTEILARTYREHMIAKANVKGVAGGSEKVLVLVTRKEPLSSLASEDVVDEWVEGVRTDVIEVGEIKPMLAPGDSIGSSATGTLGGFVVDEGDVIYALTNNHVAADSNRASVLTPIYSPGPADGTGEAFGVLGRFEPIFFDQDNLLDAALVRVDPGVAVDVDHPARTITARTGWGVQKKGRTSGRTWGTVLGRDATIEVDFGTQGVARFTGQVLTTPMLEPGDSGSVLRSQSGFPVGLGFAGSDQVSIHTPINLVLRTLAVTFLREEDGDR